MFTITNVHLDLEGIPMDFDFYRRLASVGI